MFGVIEELVAHAVASQMRSVPVARANGFRSEGSQCRGGGAAACGLPACTLANIVLAQPHDRCWEGVASIWGMELRGSGRSIMHAKGGWEVVESSRVQFQTSTTHAANSRQETQ